MRLLLALIVYVLPLAACDAREKPFIEETHCEQDTSGKQKPDEKFYTRVDASVLKSLEYPTEVIGWDEKGRNVEKIVQMPQVALKIQEGWLVGASRGEWGGEAVFIGEDSEPRILIRDNIEDIYEMPFGYVVTAGLAHLSLNSGAIYLVRLSEQKTPKAQALFALTGQPESSWKMNDGRLLINMSDSSVLLDLQGRLHRVLCRGMKYQPTKDPSEDDF